MTLRFCKKCKTLLEPHKKEGRNFLVCKNCGLSLDAENNSLITTEKIKHSPKRQKGFSKDEAVFASYKHVCKKCGYDKAEVIDMGIFYSDEDNLILLKCGKCGYSERVGRKVS